MKNYLLRDLGEFRLLKEIVLPALTDVAVLEGLGDDAGSLPWPGSGQDLVITCDRATTPLVFSLGMYDFFALGWYAVHINASDLAASGAAPLLLTSSVVAPSFMRVADFKRFFEGMASACQVFGMRNAGGNINEGQLFSCHGTAVGIVEGGRKIRRNGCQPGSIVVSIGECGLFAAAYLKALRLGLNALDAQSRQRLEKPKPRLREMLTLNSHNLITAASDCSDGVVGTLWNICEASECRIVVDMDDSKLPECVSKEAEIANLNPWNLMFFWGDWQVICTIAPENWERFEDVSADAHIAYTVLGTAEAGGPAVYANRGGKRELLRIIRNEGFSPVDYHSKGSRSVQYLLKAELFDVAVANSDEIQSTMTGK
jgi:thiamine-monophosphate kinase